MQAITTRRGVMLGDQIADQRHDAGDERILAVVPVGKEGVVGDIDATGVRARIDDLAQHRQPAKAGIEHEDGRMLRHDELSLADPGLPFSCLSAPLGR